MRTQSVPRPLKHLVHAHSYVQHWPVTIDVEQDFWDDEVGLTQTEYQMPAYIVEVKARKAKRNMYILVTDVTSPSFVKRAAARNIGDGWVMKVKHPKQNYRLRLWMLEWFETENTYLKSRFTLREEREYSIHCDHQIPQNLLAGD